MCVLENFDCLMCFGCLSLGCEDDILCFCVGNGWGVERENKKREEILSCRAVLVFTICSHGSELRQNDCEQVGITPHQRYVIDVSISGA